MAVLRVPGTPGLSEYSFGAGLMPDPDLGYTPTTADQLHAEYRNNQDPNSVSSEAAPNYDDVVVPNQKEG